MNTLQEDPNLSPVTQSQGYSFINYDFVVPIDSTTSISKFWFEVDEKDGKPATVYKNGGDGYPIEQDQLLFVPTLSQNVLRPSQNASAPWIKEFTIVAAVRLVPPFLSTFSYFVC